MAASTQARKPQQAPISSHPVFPAVVALWFAALFGIGSLVLPAALLETVAPAPLGVTTRITVALVAAAIGVVAGLVVASKVVAAQAAPVVASRPRKAPAKRPISAHEELGDEGLDADRPDQPVKTPIPGRRRPLSVTEESGRSEFLDAAPLPGGLVVAEDEETVEPVAEPADEEDALELAAFAEEEHASATEALRNDVFGTGSLSVGKPAPFHMPVAAAAPAPRQFAPPVEAIEDSAAGAPRAFDRPAHPLSDAAIPAAVADPDEGEHEAVAGEPVAEPRAFDAPAEPQPAVVSTPFGMPEPMEAEAAPEEPVAAATFDSPAAQVEVEAKEDVPASEAEPDLPLAERPLAELGMAQLVERFALSLQNRTAASASRPDQDKVSDTPEAVADESVALPFAMPARSVPQEEDEPIALPFAMPEPESAQAPEPQAPQLEIPAALQPVGMDEDEDDDDLSLGLSLELNAAPRAFARPEETETVPPSFAAFALEDDDSDEDEEDSDDGCSSLLDMKGAFGPREEFVRIEEPEVEEDAIEQVVVFPGQARAVSHGEGATRDTLGAAAARPFDAPAAREPFTGNAPAAPTAPPRRQADPAQTEQALRDALAKLQKMSGAA